MALTRYPISKVEASELLVFPILAALSKCPMNMMEIARALHLGLSTVKKRLHELEKVGYVVKRADNKWVVVVRLKIEGALKAVGVPGIDDKLDVAVEEGPGGSGSLEDDLRGLDFAHAKPEPVVKPVEVLTASQKVARQFKVPEWIEGLGSVGIGAIVACLHCKKPTPLRYDRSALCATCARHVEELKK